MQHAQQLPSAAFVRSSGRGLAGEVARHWREYLCIAPFFVLFAIFFAYPVVWSFVLSLQRWDGINTPRWVGLDNYDFVLRDSLTRKMLGNTLVLLAILVPLGLILPVVFGVLLNQSFLRLRGLFRTLIFIPVVTSTVIAGMVFRIIFGGVNGWLNGALGWFNLGPFPWLTAEGWARAPIVTLTIWGGLGFSTLIVLGALQAIDQEIFDAARVDGASPAQSFWQITLPLLRPVLVFLLITSTIATMTMFTQPYVLTDGGPRNNTLTPLLYIYRLGFGGRIGDAAALSFLLSVLMLAITFTQFFLTRSREDA
jgi:ABC-type sugar transport system permease subunit